jgi:hypothetical protein
MFCDVTLPKVRSKQVSKAQLGFRESAGDLNRIVPEQPNE